MKDEDAPATRADITALRKEIADLATSLDGTLRDVRIAGDRAAHELSVDFVIRPPSVPAEPLRGSYSLTLVGRAHIFPPVILNAVQKRGDPSGLPVPVPELRLIDEITSTTAHEVLHHALRGNGLTTDQQHRAIETVLRWILPSRAMQGWAGSQESTEVPIS